MKHQDQQDDPKFERKTKAMKRHQRVEDQEHEADEQINRLLQNPSNWRKMLEY